jgi:hypothetical protein
MAASGRLDDAPDHAERVARFLLSIVIATVLAIALAVAAATYSQRHAAATAQATERHLAVARLLADVPMPTEDAVARPPLERGTAVWHDGTGAAHLMPVLAPAGAPAGFAVPVWFDRHGTVTPPPLSGGDVLQQTVGQGVLTFCCLALVAICGYRLFRALLARRPSRRWASEWAVVEPMWTRRA